MCKVWLSQKSLKLVEEDYVLTFRFSNNNDTFYFRF